jgi:thymidine phosphorylase
MLVLGDQAKTIGEGTARMEACLVSGEAREWAERWIAAQGGDASVVGRADLPEVSEGRRTVVAPRSGYIDRIDPLRTGRLSTLLGGGRLRAQDPIDPRVGLWFHAGRGESVVAGQPLFTLYLPAGASSDTPVPGEEDLVSISDQAPADEPLLAALVTPAGVIEDLVHADLSGVFADRRS